MRACEHNSKNIQVCDKALKNHNAQIKILEVVTDFSNMDKLESEWIQKLDATNKLKGYNILSEGNASSKSGVENINAVFDTQTINEIYDLLLNNTQLSYKDIANKYQVNPATIYRIAQGYSYYNEQLNYPLRSMNHDSQRKDSYLDYFESLEILLQLKEDLLYRWDLTIENDLIKLYNIPLNILRDINTGKIFQEYGNYNYPIRPKNIRNNNNFSIQDVKNILIDLQNHNLSMTNIGLKYHIHRNTVSKINQGQAYIIKDFKYPAR